VALTMAVVKVGDGGRGFIVETEQAERVVITAAHCVAADGRHLPPAHPWSYTEERVYPNLLCPLGEAKPTVWATCLFADPLADIGVLGSPDNQELHEQAEAFEEVIGTTAPFAIADAAKQGTKRIKIGRGTKFSSSVEVRTPGRSAALVLSLDDSWLECSVARRGAWLQIEQEAIIKSGMSGSPIVSLTGHAVGVVSTGILNPVLVEALPSRLCVIGLAGGDHRRTR
jgi:hypothetical protein